MNKDIMRAVGFGDAVDTVEAGKCPTCGKPAGEFRDELSKKEFGISGMCQACQDSVFSSSEEDENELASIRRGVNRDYEAANTPNSLRALREAEQDNLNVVFPAANELQIDIDSDRAYSIYTEMLPIVEKYYGVIGVKDEPSRSGLPKRHVTITLGSYVSLNPFERIALQTCLGSDRVREVLSVVQQMMGDSHPTLFLEKKS